MQISQKIDLLLSARWIIPVEPTGLILEHHSVAVNNGRIVAILPSHQAQSCYLPARSLAYPEHAIMPGFINAHSHAAMSLLRGVADDLPLMTWLQEHIWPLEQRWVGKTWVSDGTELALAEMIQSGITCFNDMYFFPDITARVAAKAGIRGVLGMIVVDFPTPWAGNLDEYFSKGLELHGELHDSPLLTTAFAPHAPYTVSDEAFLRVRVLADELQCPVHVHLHETIDEIGQSIQHYGWRPLKRLQQLGLLNPNLVAVHATQLLDDEIALLAQEGVNVVHCPESNLKLASGFCPVAKLLDADVNIALGTDGAASNNNLDMLGEIRTAALLAKAVAGRADALPAAMALRMATLNGAQALGLSEETGSLEVGKSADMIAVDLGGLVMQPVYNPISQIVYAAQHDQISDVWVAGKALMQNRQLTTLDVTVIKQKAQGWREKLIR